MAPESILKPNFRKNPVSQAQPQLHLHPKNYGWRTGTGKARPGGGQSRSVNDLNGPPFRPEISNKVTFTSVTKQPKFSGIHNGSDFSANCHLKVDYLLNDVLKILWALIQIWISRRILHLPTEKAQQIPMSSQVWWAFPFWVNTDSPTQDREQTQKKSPKNNHPFRNLGWGGFKLPLWLGDLSETVHLVSGCLCCFMGTIFLNFRP